MNSRAHQFRPLGIAAFVVVATVWVSPATAQHPLHKHGFTGTMDGSLPFEQVDPLSGNLVVTATDLVLPGNAGLDLRVTRIYNSGLYPGYAQNDLTLEEDSWAGIGWRLHFGRVLNPADTGSGETVIEMGDGSRHPLYTNDAFSEGWITRGFWRYDRSTHTLTLPNGVTYVFGPAIFLNDTLGEVLYVTEIRDVFNNRLTFTYFDENGPRDGVQQIRQDLGGSQVRYVTFTYDAALKNLASMSYDGRTWTYEQAAAGPEGHGVLRFVRPPNGQGLPWEYQYSTSAPGHELTKVITPLGGSATYTYADAQHRTGSITTLTRVVATRALGGRDVVPGTWTFTYDAGANQDETHVSSPCNVTRYRFYGHGLSGDFSPWLVGALAERILESNGTELERETYTYLQSEPVSPDYLPGDEGMASSNGVYNTLPATRAVTRGGHTWTTTFSYRTGQGTFNDFGQPYEIHESKNVYQYRTTTRTFRHDFTPYIRGRVATQAVFVRTAHDQSSGPASSSWTYDTATGFLTGQTLYGLSSTFGPTAEGNVAWVADGRGNATNFQYSWGRISRVQTPHVTTHYSVNADGNILWTNVDNLTTNYTYDAAFRPRVTTPPYTNPISIDYDDVSARTTHIWRDGRATRLDVDGFGRTYFTQDPTGVKTRAQYDACGRQTFASAPYTAGGGSRGVTTAYDGLGRPVTSTHTDGSVTQFAYTGTTATITDAENRVTTYEYVDFGGPGGERLVRVTDAASQSTTYQYDVLNNLTRVSVPGVPDRTWVYGGALLTSDTQPEAGTTTYGYDAAGNRTSRTDALNVTTLFHYDASNRLWKIDPPGTADDITITFDPIYGRPTSQATSAVTTTFGYDASGRLASRSDAVDGHSFTSTSTLDGNDLLRTIAYPSGRVITYDYDAANRLAAVKNNGAVFADLFTYGDTGALASYRTGTVTHAVTLDDRDRVNRLTALNAGAQGLDLTYTYDRVSQVTEILDPRLGASQFFGYDTLGRVTSALGPWGITNWTYNAAGDRMSEQSGDLTTSTYDAATRRLASLSGAFQDSFTYDAVGRLKSDTRGSYDYNLSGLLAQVTTPTTTATYAYDPSGLRLTRTVNGLMTYTTRSLGGQPLSEYQAGCGPLVWTRDTVYAGGRPLGAIEANLSPPSISMVAASVSVPEALSVVLHVQLTTPNGAATTCPVTVSYAAAPGSAGPADFWLPAGTVMFPAGTASGTTRPITVGTTSDALNEISESFIVNLATADGAILAGTTSTTMTITDDDAAPTVSIANATAQEGTGASGVLSFVLTLSAPSGQTVWLSYTTANRTAAPPGDYAAASGTVAFPAGETTATIDVTIVGDADDEPDEVLAMLLSNGSHVALGRAIATGRIVDDDGGTLTPARDFNGDGWADLVWRHAVTGQLSVWYMQAITMLSGTLTVPAQQDDFDYELRAVGDFNGDWKPDLVWQRRTDGHLAVWFFDGHVLIGTASVTTLSGGNTEPDLAWKIVAAADMDRDGLLDLVWRREGTGELRIWHMSGTLQMDSVPIALGVGAEPWQVVGTGDLNGDGWADLVWRHDDTGGLATWLMADAQLLATEWLFPDSLPDLQWRIVGVADMNGDGHPDLVWQHAGDGRISAWFMNGLTMVSGELMQPDSAGDVGWKIGGVR